jgi:hypothetical protein
VRADDDQVVAALQRADQRVVEAERLPAAGHRQDDVAQRARIEADLAAGDAALMHT